jgi:hypothetical protein
MDYRGSTAEKIPKLSPRGNVARGIRVKSLIRD